MCYKIERLIVESFSRSHDPVEIEGSANCLCAKWPYAEGGRAQNFPAERKDGDSESISKEEIAMRIQHNISAMNAYRNFNTNNSKLTKNLDV